MLLSTMESTEKWNFFRKEFILLLQTGALTCDRHYNKRIAHHVLSWGLKIPESIFEDYSDPFIYVANILDFEYGLFDKLGEEYPEWVKKYEKWKFSTTSMKSEKSKLGNTNLSF